MKVQVQQGSRIAADTEKQGVAKIHLTGKAGQQIPAGGENRKYTGQSENAQQIGIFDQGGKEQEHNKKEKHDDPAR